MEKELVSIITPMYQAEAYLSDAIRSVISQDYQNWELFIVDDGSTDKSVDIAETFAKVDDRITVMKFNGKPQSGAALCRNAAMRLANGQYISFIDSDDTWEPYFLSAQLRFMKETNCPFVYSSYLRKTPRKTDEYFVPSRTTYQSILKTNPITCLTVLIDVSAIGLPLMPEKALYREDIACFYELLRAKTPLALGNPEVLATYRLHIGSVSYNKWKMLRYEWRLFYRIEKLGFFKSCFYMWHWFISGIKYYRHLNRRPIKEQGGDLK